MHPLQVVLYYKYYIEYGSTVSLFQDQDVWNQAQKQQWYSWYYCTFQGTVL